MLVAAYLRMLEAELRNEPLVKSHVNAEVQQHIDRSRASIEYKFQNVSAVLRDLRHPFINGYKPASNYQESLVDAVALALDDHDSLAEAALRAITGPASDLGPPVDWHHVSPPQLEFGWLRRSQRVAVRRDYVALDAANRELGLAGELAVVEHERSLLLSTGRPELAEQVEHVSHTRGDGLGYDVLSFDANGAQKFIEVKTTREGCHWPMLVTRNEVDFSSETADQFHLYRVFDFAAGRAGLFTLPGSIQDTCVLSATTFEASARRAG